MIQFQTHSDFDSEFKRIAKKYPGAKQGLIAIQRLLSKYFDPDSPNRSAIGPGKIHHLKDYYSWSLWKVEVMVDGLKPSLWPRMWFAIEGDNITLLTIGMHNNNYNDNDMLRAAISRYAD